MAHLFSKIVLQDALKNVSIPDIESKIAILQEWNEMYRKWELQKKKETAFEATYSEKLFWTILGYDDVGGGLYTREKHPKNASNGQTCDIGLGYYASDKNETQAVVELKDAGTSIDRPQQREGNMTPIQQGFKYKPLYNSRWVIVSNYYEFRLYRDTYQDYETWTLADLTDPANDHEKFRIFYLLLRAESLISETGESETEKILAKVRIEQELITKKFYKEYADLRKRLMRDIWTNNVSMQGIQVIAKTQRIIDRLVFIYFCEDNKWLLPPDRLTENITQAKSIWFSVWDTIKMYFRSIAEWNNSQSIPHYNWGLFKEDPEIDNLKISDDLCQEFADLGRYDFSEDGGQLSVEILGHIFEQSISDLEGIRNQIQSAKTEIKEEKKEVSKRKKDGIFYTPAYIVDYIVRNSLGKYLEEHEEKVIEKYKLKGDIAEKTYRKREIEAYTEYQKILHTVKVLDPACGSGAFLVRVFDFLFAENKRVRDIIYGEKGVQLKVGDDESTYRLILKNNIYWVDLNEESVEITRLSLWLKTLRKGEKLQTLDNNIKCGNSLIDDPAVAGDKAFNWNTEFAEIMASGGFDVIVGNPPYIEIQKLSSWDVLFLKNKYETAKNKNIDIYIVFYEKWLHLLKSNWILSYITPNRFLNSEYWELLLKFLSVYNIVQILNFRHYLVFEDADTYTLILSIQNAPQQEKVRYLEFKWLYVTDSDKASTFLSSWENYKFISSKFKNDKVWNLVSEEEDSIIKKCNKNDELKDFVQDFFVWVQTSFDNFYILKFVKDIDDKMWLFYSSYLSREIEVEKDFLLEIISNPNVKKYFVQSEGEFIVFPYRNGKLLDYEFIRSNYPKVYDYFEIGKIDLENREKWKFKWNEFYRFWRMQNVDKQNYKKLLIPHVTKSMRCSFDEKGDFAMNNVWVNGLVLKEEKQISYKYMLCLLNSRLLTFILSKISIFLAWWFFASNKQFAEKLPVKVIPQREQQSFIEKADLMLSLNRDLQDKSGSFLKNIQAKYSVSKITRKLEKWWELDFAEFLKETKISVSLAEQEELMQYFDTRRAEVRAIDAEIRKTDTEIDNMVFDLYGLTEGERGIVLNS
jgi:uncharacterized small protein (DUF1192 family)